MTDKEQILQLYKGDVHRYDKQGQFITLNNGSKMSMSGIGDIKG